MAETKQYIHNKVQYVHYVILLIDDLPEPEEPQHDPGVVSGVVGVE